MKHLSLSEAAERIRMAPRDLERAIRSGVGPFVTKDRRGRTAIREEEVLLWKMQRLIGEFAMAVGGLKTALRERAVRHRRPSRSKSR